jgi:hypothetical protein
MNGPKATSGLIMSPFDSQLRTLVGAARRSHSCQEATYAVQQTSMQLDDAAGTGVVSLWRTPLRRRSCSR